MDIPWSVLEEFLGRRHGETVQINQLHELGGPADGATALKAFGYGRPVQITYHHGGKQEQVVLRQVQRNGFGRELAADRMAAVWLDYETFSDLPGHIKALDVIGVSDSGQMMSLGHVQHLLLLTDYAQGKAYANDLLCMRDTGRATRHDHERTVALAEYLVRIHRLKKEDPLLWRRRLRDLVGHGEGIMGLTDSYPSDFTLVSPERLVEIEQAAIHWRWRLKPLVHRLSQVHGDFHPFNIMFRPETADFKLIDRSRGAWGEPADDVSCMSINYLFFSLQRSGYLEGVFGDQYTAFWETYLGESGDEQILHVVQPWYAWRALVLASPNWYPNISDEVRLKLLTFAERVMRSDVFDWRDPNALLES